MEEIFRDPIWQFIGAVLGLIAIIATIAIYLLQRRRKSLVYELVTSAPLLSMSDEVKGKVQILYEGSPVQLVHLLIINVVNDGNLGIQASDFERPLAFQFGEDSQILSVEIAKTIPENLKPVFNVEKNKIEFSPMLINSGDLIALSILIAQFDKKISVDARILGVSEVKQASITTRILERIWAYMTVGTCVLLFAAFLSQGKTFVPALILGFFALLLNAYIQNRKKRIYLPPSTIEKKRR